MSLETVCRTCGKPFTASTADVRAGTWRTCSDCRTSKPAETPAPHGSPR